MTNKYNIAVLKGDGIGPEIVDQGIKALDSIAEKYNHKFNYQYCLIGGAALDEFEVPLPACTLEICKKADAVLLGAVGNPKYDNIAPHLRPEQALLKIRKELNLFANLRPVLIFDELISASPIKEIIIKGVDIMIVRELTGGLYFGQPRAIVEEEGNKHAYNTMAYSQQEIERIAHIGFQSALKRRKKLCSVDKANVLEVSRLWREVVIEVSKQYQEVELSHMYVDNAAMQLVRNPGQFDVIVTENMFGDILSDEASMLSGSLGLLASASLSDSKVFMYEPIHGSAPDIAGQNKANPIATILSVAMMLKYSFGLSKESEKIENAVNLVLKQGYRTADIYENQYSLVGTSEMGDLICYNILNS